jgi:glycosyltransferase involved in cell wall biosynthesis/SAM-dependent methyltransferase
MPTYNRDGFVPEAIRYFLRQNYDDAELIILDDGTEPVGGLVPADERLRYIRLEDRRSVGAKRNMACELASGELIAHWDDDDWQAPDRLSRQCACLLDSNANLCGVNSLLFYDLHARLAWRYIYPPQQRPWLAGNCLMYRRSFWASHRFEELDIGEDTRFVWSARPQELITLPGPPIHVGMIHEGNVSAIQPGGPWWHSCPPDEVRRILGEDWGRYMRQVPQASPKKAAAGTGPAGFGITNPLEVTGVATASRSVATATCHGSTVLGQQTCEVGIVVTCHAAYLPYLSAALDSIDKQDPSAVERVLVLDGCEGPPVRAGWQVITGSFRDPSLARNAGLERTAAAWIIFWDADNVMPPGYLAAVVAAAVANPDCAILYPDLQYCDNALRPTRPQRQMPEWDYWGLRSHNTVDTASAWRREALAMVGAWPRYLHSSHEDYALALDLTAAGWRAARLGGPAVVMRDHGDGRNLRSMTTGEDLDDIWRARSLGIVTPLAPRPSSFERWWKYLREAELPPKTSLYIVDNTGDPGFSAWINEACHDLRASRGIGHVEITAGGAPFISDGRRDAKDRHHHVAKLYAMVLPRVREDFVLTLEDDVEPPLDAPRLLGRTFCWGPQEGVGGQPIGAVAAAYGWPGMDALVCAGFGDTEWGDAPGWEALGDGSKPLEVGFVGGGCTMWANWALRGTPVRFHWDRERRLGWDAGLCADLRRRGWRILLHGGVRCQHHHIDEVAMGTVGRNGVVAAVRVPSGATTLGQVIPPWRPVLARLPRLADGYVSEGHRRLAARGAPDAMLQGDVPGWLWMADALTLYELAYGCEGDILELGCFHGLSTSILAEALAARGLPRRSLLSIDKEAEAVALARGTIDNAGLGDWVNVAQSDATSACKELLHAARRFGLVFVDHSHSYAAMLPVCRMVAGLLAPGGYVLFHDYNDGRNADPNNADYEVVRAVADGLEPKAVEFVGLFGCSAMFRKR